MKKQVKVTNIISKETQGITIAKYLLSIGVYKEENTSKEGVNNKTETEKI
ncbi:hypothetical protein [Neobacillus niacini]|nr:hypothetical protein [Neobacillus niacini]MCM3764619.1 hypothetical protein [Neobacillus niacini]